MNNFLFRSAVIMSMFATTLSFAQTTKYNLSELLKEGRFTLPKNQRIIPLVNDSPGAVSVTGIIWLSGVNFSTGTIDVDIRGKDVFQQSFLGIAFHAIDTVTYDAVYFRPFNFRAADTLRQKHMVQYMSEPDYPWDKLRSEHPLMYESGIIAAPLAIDWFHARIVVTTEEISVFVNDSLTPSLKVKKLNNRSDGLVGLWSSALSGDFANIVIRNGL